MYQSFPQRNMSRSNTAMPVIRDNHRNDCVKEEKQEKCELKIPDKCEEKSSNPLSFLNSFQLDDIILIGIILFLLYEGSNDIITIALLAVILFF